MYHSPYNLTLNTDETEGVLTNKFYDNLEFFTGYIINIWSQKFDTIINEFESYIALNNNKQYSKNEYLMEILMAGVFFTNRKKYLSYDAINYRQIFSKLYDLRKKLPKHKSKADAIRGKLAQKILLKEHNINIDIEQRLRFLLAWLDCSKEYTQETERLKLWNSFLLKKNTQYVELFWENALSFANWFIHESKIQLSVYTKDWETFISETKNIYINREDNIFCTRTENEYHLNMVAAQIMNQSLQKAFIKTKQKVLLLPTCMAKNINCKALQNNSSLTCNQCTTNCNVNIITKLMAKKGIKTVLIAHSTNFSEYLVPWQNQSETALIGVACVLNLLTGGYEMQKLNIPSQCVFLNTCGCKKHWLSGINANINVKQIEKILKYGATREPVNSTC